MLTRKQLGRGRLPGLRRCPRLVEIRTRAFEAGIDPHKTPIRLEVGCTVSITFATRPSGLLQVSGTGGPKIVPGLSEVILLKTIQVAG